jgi:hypothetical protein
VTGKGARDGLPDEATEVERMVGLFDAERAAGATWGVSEFNRNGARELTEDEIPRVRDLCAELFGKWVAVPPGELLALEFAPGPVSK